MGVNRCKNCSIILKSLDYLGCCSWRCLTCLKLGVKIIKIGVTPPDSLRGKEFKIVIIDEWIQKEK